MPVFECYQNFKLRKHWLFFQFKWLRLVYLHIVNSIWGMVLLLFHSLQDLQRNFGLYGGNMAPSEKYATHRHFMPSLCFPHSASSMSWVMISQLSITSPQPSPVQVSSDISNISWSNSWLPSAKFCPRNRRIFLSFRRTAYDIRNIEFQKLPSG